MLRFGPADSWLGRERGKKKQKKSNSLGHQIDSPRLVCGWDDGERRERGGSVRMDNATERKESERERMC